MNFLRFIALLASMPLITSCDVQPDNQSREFGRHPHYLHCPVNEDLWLTVHFYVPDPKLRGSGTPKDVRDSIPKIEVTKFSTKSMPSTYAYTAYGLSVMTWGHRDHELWGYSEIFVDLVKHRVGVRPLPLKGDETLDGPVKKDTVFAMEFTILDCELIRDVTNIVELD